MRRTMMVLALGVLATGCSKGSDTSTATNTVNPAPSASSTAFAPPTSISRLDYGSRTERRFHKLDKNKDDKIGKDELPERRAARMLKRFDTNGDGTIDATEWSKAMLARFDKEDANKDGNLTSDERGGRGGKRGGKRGKRGGGDAPIEDNGDEVDNGL